MGAKTSKQQQYSSPQDQNGYQNNARSYSTWTHRAGLASNDVSRSSTQEIQNLSKHNQLISSSLSQINLEENKVISSSKNEIQSLPYNQNQSKASHRKQSSYDPSIRGKPLGLRKSQSTDHLPSSTIFITAQELLKDQSKRTKRDKSSSSSQISVQSYPNQGVQKSASTITANQLLNSAVKRKKIPDDLQFVMIDSNLLQVSYAYFHKAKDATIIFSTIKPQKMFFFVYEIEAH
jgi:hypothetical protein